MRLPLLLAALLLGAAVPAAADPIADFYKGRTVYLLIGLPVGGSYDLEARLLARHLGAHLPGNPTIVPQNMVGGGGIAMANYLAKVAAQDGSYLGMMANTLVISQAMGVQAIRYDAAKFHWIGSIMPGTHSAMIAWRTTGVQTLEDARKRELTVGASTKGAFVYTMPALLNEFYGTRFKIITGYQGINSGYLAMESGETDANAATWAEFKVLHPDYVVGKKINVLVQNGPRIPELADVPTLQELAKSDDDRRSIELLLSGDRIGRPVAAAPDTPPARVAALRAAFDATMTDPAFRQDAEKSQTEIDPVSGEKMQSLVAEVLATPRPLVERVRKIIE